MFYFICLSDSYNINTGRQFFSKTIFSIGFKLTIIYSFIRDIIYILNQDLLNTEIIDDLIKIFHLVYPIMVATYPPTASKTVIVETE